MSLDNALRSGLVREGEAIAVDVAAAVPAIDALVRAQRRRRALEGVAVAVVVALVVWAPPGLVTETTKDEGPRPAREPFPQERRVERQEPVERRGVPGTPGGRLGKGSRVPSFEAASQRRTEAAGTAGDLRRGGAAERPPASKTAVGMLPRQMVERYEVAYVSGTHFGENAGTGCSQGWSAMGSNDCIPIRVHEGETAISLRITDDEGTLVGAHVYQHAGGEGTELVSFCGSTKGYIPVEPGALLLVYVETSDRCSEARPRTGTLSALFR